MSYRNLNIWKLAQELTTDIHLMSLDLPKFEMFEVGSQIGRSSKSVRSNIVEGYGERPSKNDFIRFLTFALVSNDETIDHLEILFETKSLKDTSLFNKLKSKIDLLGKKINKFRTSVLKNHTSEK